MIKRNWEVFGDGLLQVSLSDIYLDLTRKQFNNRLRVGCANDFLLTYMVKDPDFAEAMSSGKGSVRMAGAYEIKLAQIMRTKGYYAVREYVKATLCPLIEDRLRPKKKRRKKKKNGNTKTN